MKKLFTEKLILILALNLFIPGKAHSQNQELIDSLRFKSEHCTNDSNRVNVLTDIAWEYIGNNPGYATSYCMKAVKLALQIGYLKGVGIALYFSGINYYYENKYDKAMTASLQAVTIFKHINDRRRMASAYNNIGNIYWALGELDPALENQRRALIIQQADGNLNGVSSSLLNIGVIFDDKKIYDSALALNFKALEIVQKNGSEMLNSKTGRIYNNIGVVYTHMNRPDDALKYYLLSVEFKEKAGIMQDLATTYGNIGQIYLYKNDFQKSEYYYLKQLSLGKSAGSADDRRLAYKGLALVNKELGKYNKAYEYLIEFTSLNEDQYDIESTKKVAELQVKYETQIKERQIEKLTNEKEIQSVKLQQARIILISGIVAVLLLCAIFIILFINYKQKQARKRMVNTIIDTEEKERKRFAEDLHDGLGPLLSSIGLYLNEISSDRHQQSEKDEFINMATGMIDEAIASTRSIARNLMPGVLSDYGLGNAIESFCHKLKQARSPEITLEIKDKNKRYPAVIEVTLYRTILELLNNTMKHTSASGIQIHIADNEKKLCITYMDNGEGFDVDKTLSNPEAGLGLKNIINRIKSVNGSCYFQSEKGRGMKVFLDINYKIF
jgi:two-component system, NarL family, sensor kinase